MLKDSNVEVGSVGDHGDVGIARMNAADGSWCRKVEVEACESPLSNSKRGVTLQSVPRIISHHNHLGTIVI
jgi:hypothetical protein